MKKTWIGTSWKMNKTRAEAKLFAEVRSVFLTAPRLVRIKKVVGTNFVLMTN